VQHSHFRLLVLWKTQVCQVSLVLRLRRILLRLQEAPHPRSANAPGFRLHPLKGDRTGQWSVRASGNWRVVFRFEDGEAVDVDLIDYH